MPVTDRGWPEKAGVSPGVSDVVRFLIRLQREHTHPHARTHTQTLDTHTLPADVWRMLFFLRGMRWAVAGGGGRRWHWLGKGVRVAGPLFYSLVITGGGGYWYIAAGTTGNTHILERARIQTTYTVRLRTELFITRWSANITRYATCFNESTEMRFSLSLRFSVYVPSDI